VGADLKERQSAEETKCTGNKVYDLARDMGGHVRV